MEMECRYPVHERSFESFDGTRIAYYEAGRGKSHIVIANGLGGNWFAWKYFIDYFGNRFRILLWDYRGLYRSARPANLDTVSPEQQCGDLEALLKREKVSRAILAGWSMGVQVCFEYYRSHADQVAAILAFCGVDGKPFDSFINNVRLRALVPRAITFLERTGGPQKKVMNWLIEKPWSLNAMKAIGMVAPSISEEVFSVVSREFVRQDFEVYFRTLKLLGEHDASDVLPDVQAPVLIVYGERDNMTPVSRAMKMHKQLPKSEMMIIPGGTHYAPIEFPEWINLRVEKFLGAKGLLREPGR